MGARRPVVLKLYASRYVCRPGCMMQVRLAVLRPAARLGAAASYPALSMDVPSQAHELISARSVAVCGAARWGGQRLVRTESSSRKFMFSIFRSCGLKRIAVCGAAWRDGRSPVSRRSSTCLSDGVSPEAVSLEAVSLFTFLV